MEMHSGEEIIYNGHPSWRSIKAFYLGGLAIAFAVGLLWWLVASHFWAVVVFAAIVGATIVVGLVKRVFVTYTITSDRLSIQRGVLAKRVEQTRIDRVQNVSTSQSALDRIFRVGTVDFDTAGSDSANLRFDGVDDPPAVAAAIDRAQRLHAEALAGSGTGNDGLA
uniref:Unannotated protein n=1 Tax=freshwater metagenome TaxID=449393 RepID=A0A6J5ZZA2_9ZZZZ